MPNWKHLGTVSISTFVLFDEEGNSVSRREARTDTPGLTPEAMHRAYVRHIEAWATLEQELLGQAAAAVEQAGQTEKADSWYAEEARAVAPAQEQAAGENGARPPGTAICPECELPLDRSRREALWLEGARSDLGNIGHAPRMLRTCQDCGMPAWNQDAATLRQIIHSEAAAAEPVALQPGQGEED